jgi:IclR family transcriptional regulator, KDG regulon repressor
MDNMKSLRKAFEILEIFLEVKAKDLRLSDLAKLTGLKIATVNRICIALVELGYLNQMEKRGKYSLGTKFLYFDNVLKQENPSKEIIRNYLVKLNESVEETVVLVNFDGRRIYYIDEVPSKHTLRIDPDPIAITPLYCSGLGKIFLSSYPEKKLEEYFRNTEIRAFTPNTITDLDVLKKHLIMVARDGIAYDDEELIPGVRNVAAGIVNTKGVFTSGVGVLGPSVRLTPAKMIEIAPQVKQCAKGISEVYSQFDMYRRSNKIGI